MQRWLEVEPNAQVRAALERRRHNEDQFLAEVFPPNAEKRLEFGTAGLRAEFGPGPLRMNEVIVMQTCQGILRQILLEDAAGLKERGICIGYDHRESREWGLSSKRFALVAHAVFRAYTDRIYVFDRVCPTPFVPFSVQRFACLAGFMFTASHNPKQDAGFKVYWKNACQIASPLDKEISKQIMLGLQDENLANALLTVRASQDYSLEQTSLTPGLYEEVQAAYLATVKQKLFRAPTVTQVRRNMCYTAMHGCGQDTALRLFKEFNLRDLVHFVPSQAEPDCDFPTVKFPNPEERGALDVAIAFAQANGCELILANDPDADRLGVAEFNGKTWTTLSGDEIAMLLAWWEMKHMNRSNGRPKAMVVSAVSSAFLSKMGSAQGVQVFETLTGFKWIGAKALDLREKQGYDVLLAYEEAIGFCIGDNICDKDGISAAAVFAQLYQAIAPKTCGEMLDELRREHGYYLTKNHYLKMPPQDQLARFAQMRNWAGEKNKYAQVVGKARPRRVTRVRDLETRVDTSLPPGREPLLPHATSMITYYLDAGERITLRASGTEPKLKYYVECIGKTFAEAAERCEEVVRDVVLGDLLHATKRDNSAL